MTAPAPLPSLEMSPVLMFEIVAVVLAALSAMITAAKKELDFVGTYALALVTSFGGGSIRDLVLDRRPFFWVSRWEYLIIIFVLCIPFVYNKRVHDLSRRLVARGEFVDALGLGFFSVVGVTFALDARMPWPVAVLMGVITAVGGGIMRDLVINEIPVVFRHGSTLYTTSAFASAVVFIILRKAHSPAAVTAAVTVGVVVRLLSVWRGTTLPRPHWIHTGNFKVPTDDHDGPRTPPRP